MVWRRVEQWIGWTTKSSAKSRYCWRKTEVLRIPNQLNEGPVCEPNWVASACMTKTHTHTPCLKEGKPLLVQRSSLHVKSPGESQPRGSWDDQAPPFSFSRVETLLFSSVTAWNCIIHWTIFLNNRIINLNALWTLNWGLFWKDSEEWGISLWWPKFKACLTDTASPLSTQMLTSWRLMEGLSRLTLVLNILLDFELEVDFLFSVVQSIFFHEISSLMFFLTFKGWPNLLICVVRRSLSRTAYKH